MTTYFEAKTNTGKIQIKDASPNIWMKSKTKLGQYYVKTVDIRYCFLGNDSYSIIVNDWLRNYTVPTLSQYDMYIYELPEDALCYLGNPDDSISVHVFCNHTEVTIWGQTKYEKEYLGSKKYVGITYCTKNQADNLDVYIFTQGKITESSSCGLECYNAQNEKIFDSNCPPLKLLNNINHQHCEYANGNTLSEYPTSYTAINRTIQTNGKSIAVWVSLAGTVHTTAQRYDAYGRIIGVGYQVGPCLSTVAVLSKNTVQFRTICFIAFKDQYVLNLVLKLKYNRTMASVINVTNY